MQTPNGRKSYLVRPMRSTRAGFTLIETIVALAICAISFYLVMSILGVLPGPFHPVYKGKAVPTKTINGVTYINAQAASGSSTKESPASPVSGSFELGNAPIAMHEYAITDGPGTNVLTPGKAQPVVFGADNVDGYNKPLPAISIENWTSDHLGCNAQSQYGALTLNASPTPTVPTGYGTSKDTMSGFATITFTKSVPSACVGAELTIYYDDGPDVWFTPGLATVPGSSSAG